MKFETGKSYKTSSVGTFKIAKRTEKSIWITGSYIKAPERRKITVYDGIETALPLGSYSMSQEISADKLA